MIRKTINVSGESHQVLRKEAFVVGVTIKVLAEFKIKKPLSKEDIKKLKSV